MEDFRRKSFLKRNATGILILIAIIIFGILIYKGWGKIVDRKIDDMVTITGNFSCLPLQDVSAPEEDKCNLGVKSRDGLYYALDTSRVQDINTDLKADDTIAVTGIMGKESDVVTSAWAKYDIKNIIKVNMLLRTR